MPYTKSELETVRFYQEFVSDLRNKYLGETKKFLNSKFRKNGILYSFEDIHTGLGLEDSITEDSSDYSFLHTEDYSMYPAWLVSAMKSNPDLVLEPIVTDHREDQYSKADTKYPLYEKGELLDKVIDREITELTTPEQVGGTLPVGPLDEDGSPTYEVKNGDRVAIEEIFTKGNAVGSVDVWLIEDNKKRKYLDNFTFFSSAFSKSTIKLIEPSALNSIVDGKDITVGWRGWTTDKGSEGVY